MRTHRPNQDGIALELYAALVRNAKQVRFTRDGPTTATANNNSNTTHYTIHTTISGHIFDCGIWVKSTHRRRHAQTRPRASRRAQVCACFCICIGVTMLIIWIPGVPSFPRWAGGI